MTVAFTARLQPDTLTNAALAAPVDVDDSGPFAVGRMKMWFVEISHSGTYTTGGDSGLAEAIRLATGAKQIFQVLPMGLTFMSNPGGAVQWVYDSFTDKVVMYVSTAGEDAFVQVANGATIGGYTRGARVMGD